MSEFHCEFVIASFQLPIPKFVFKSQRLYFPQYRLEGQLSEQLSDKTTLHEYEGQINDLNDVIASRRIECEALKQSENNLRTALRQIRDEASRNGTAANGIATWRSIVDIVDSVLHSATKISSNAVTHADSHSMKNSRNRNMLSPRYKKHIELMHSSDSDCSDDDSNFGSYEGSASSKLMADLALIAKGIIPPSLRSPQILEAASKLDSDALGGDFTPQMTSNGTKTKSTNEFNSNTDLNPNNCPIKDEICNLATNSEVEKHLYQSVFDRLGSPSQFTGTQKEKFNDSRQKRDRLIDETKVVDKDPRNNIFIGSSSAVDARPGEVIDRTDYIKQNVFDRLQKTITQAAAIRQSETLHLESRLNVDAKTHESATLSHEVIHRNHHDENKHSLDAVDHSAENQIIKNSGESRTTINRAAYAKQNVFDRLQKTTTQAAAVRQSETLHMDNRQDSTDFDNHLPKKSDGKRSSATSSKSERTDNMNINVFERLSKTTTHAYAKKTNRQLLDE
jgi:hypothetical protein